VLTIGVDPGLHGAIAFVRPGFEPTVVVMPLLDGTERDQYDVTALRTLLDRRSDAVPCSAIVERLAPMPMKFRRKGSAEKIGGGGVIANYNRGVATHLVIGLLAGLGIPYTPVLPQVWQREMLADVPGADTKAKSVWLARRLFPSCSLLATPRSRKPHDGLADALLLAEWGRRKLAGDQGRQMGLLSEP
jgi:hypothetical protein